MTTPFARSIAAVTLFVAGGAASAAEAQTAATRWHGDLPQAAELARSSGKPLFVVFRCVR